MMEHFLSITLLCEDRHGEQQIAGVIMSRTFRTQIAGITHNNTDGTKRRDILRECIVGERLLLQRNYDNAFDEYAIAVLRKTGEQIGFVPRHVAFRHPAMNDLAPHMDQGGEAGAKIVSIVGGECEIEIEVVGSDSGKPYQLREAEARDLRDKAKTLEKSDPKEAIRLYRQSLVKMIEVDSLIRETHFFKNQIAELGYDLGTWRRSSLPIERITALLEKEKRYKECLAEIENYENLKDWKGLGQADMRTITIRKDRVKSKITGTD
jgi:hypothetical protein